MSYEKKEKKEYPNTWALFPNKYKKEDKHPDYTGKALITADMVGKEIKISGWLKTSKKTGEKFMSGEFTHFQPKTDETREYTTTAPDNAEVPF